MAGEGRSFGVGGRAPIGLCPGRVVVTLNPQSSGTQWETVSEKGRDLELSTESPCELQQPEPSPFSSKRTMYETEEVSPPPPPRLSHCGHHLWDWAVARVPQLRGESSVLGTKGL